MNLKLPLKIMPDAVGSRNIIDSYGHLVAVVRGYDCSSVSFAKVDNVCQHRAEVIIAALTAEEAKEALAIRALRALEELERERTAKVVTTSDGKDLTLAEAHLHALGMVRKYKRENAELKRRVTDLEKLWDRDSAAATKFQADNKRMLRGNGRIGSWLSAALGDPKVCAEMKSDIEAWFESHDVEAAIAAARKDREG